MGIAIIPEDLAAANLKISVLDHSVTVCLLLVVSIVSLR